MTTIAYRNGVLAADSLITQNGARCGFADKIFRRDDGSLCGVTGDLSAIQVMREWDGAGHPRYDGTDVDGIVVRPDGEILAWDGKYLSPLRAEFWSGGSGWRFAFGAMEMGASSYRAVEIAIALDTTSGGPIKTLRLEGFAA